MKKVFALIEKKSAKFAQSPFFEFLVDKSIAFIQRLFFAPCFALFLMGYGNFNKFVCLQETTVNSIQYTVNKQICEEKNHWIWFLKDLKNLDFNLFLNLADSLKFNWSDRTAIFKQIIYQLYRRTFEVNAIYGEKQDTEKSLLSACCLLPPAFVDKIFQLFTALVNIVINFAEEYNIKQLLTRSFDSSDFPQLPCQKKATVGV
ncbi:hypothetical protein [Nostoc sp.]|uniref:hypothetical protein n=1 Tax=Nostoc sp. TaxID=1180 RepID=UPI002FFA78BD